MHGDVCQGGGCPERSTQHFISSDQYRREIQRLNSVIEAASVKYEEAVELGIKQYEQYVMGEGSKEAIAAARPAREQAQAELKVAIAEKATYEEQYRIFCKLMKVSRKKYSGQGRIGTSHAQIL